MMKRPWAVTVGLLTVLSATSLRAQESGSEAVASELKWRVEQLRVSGALEVGRAVVLSRDLTLAVYEQRGFLPVWTEPPAFESLLRAIAAAAEDGLDPEHYGLPALSAPEPLGPDASDIAERDLLATDAFVRIAHDVRFGKVQPQGPVTGTTAAWPFGGPEAVDNLLDVVASGMVERALTELRPKHFVYMGLMGALADLRRVQEEGGWEVIPVGPHLARGSTDARVLPLRRRLLADGDLAGGVGAWTPRFDADLEAAVRSFQHRHGLNEDGVVGDATLAALNVPVERRIEQVRVNLERARWVAHELPDSFVVVNAAGAKVYLLSNDTVAFETRAIVGTWFTQTPVFAAPMLYIDLNPTWTVPAGIVPEILREVRRDPGYLASQGMRVLDASGRDVDPTGIDFSRYTAGSFPYVFRQDPGPTNALGRIKLMFPNEHRVYLHDTPARGLFAREVRLFSHGCIRIEDPLGLAELVLGDGLNWNRAALQTAIDSGLTWTLQLPKPLPVFVLYWTAAVDVQGVLHVYRDVYGRDAGVLAGLDAGPGIGTAGGLER